MNNVCGDKSEEEEEEKAPQRPIRKWTAREDDEFMLQFRQLRKTLFRHLVRSRSLLPHLTSSLKIHKL
jgi:hypothetical protein